MRKIISLIVVLGIGALLMFVAMNYHIVRANDGHHMIRKSTANLSSSYVDIREFTVSDWKQQSELAKNIANSDDETLLQEALQSGFSNTAENILRGALEGLKQ